MTIARLRPAKRVWACSHCGHVHDRPAGAGKKHRQCHGCQEQAAVRCFDSMAEFKRFTELLTLQRYGAISDLKVQVPFAMVVNGRKVGEPWRADFSYLRDGQLVVEEVKGIDEPYQRLRRELAIALYGITVEIIGPAKRIRSKRPRLTNAQMDEVLD